MRRVLGSTAVAACLLGVGCGNQAAEESTTRDSEGAIVEGGDLGAFKIRLGDCLGDSVDGEVRAVAGVPCTQPHQSEVYHAFALPEGDGTFPGVDQVQTLADQGCLDAFQGFVGIDYESSVYEISTVSPTARSWDSVQDREVLCLVGQPAGTLSTGSIRNTAK
jgi:hypothetical protein